MINTLLIFLKMERYKFFKSFQWLYTKKKQIAQYLIFRCDMSHLNYSLNKLGKTFRLQRELLTTEMNHDEISSDTWKDKKSEWSD